MIRAVRAARLGGQLGLDRPHLPGVGTGVDAGQWISASGTCSACLAAGWSARSRRSLCHQAGRHSRRGRRPATAGQPGRRGCAPGGRARGGWPGSPARWRPSRPGSAAQAGPGPSLPVAAYPARRHRAVIAGSRSSPRGARGEQVQRDAVMLPGQQEPVDVALRQPDAPGIRRRAAGTRLPIQVGWCYAGAPSWFLTASKRTGAPAGLCAFTTTRDVTILPRERRGDGGVVSVSASSGLRFVMTGPGRAKAAMTADSCAAAVMMPVMPRAVRARASLNDAEAPERHDLHLRDVRQPRRLLQGLERGDQARPPGRWSRRRWWRSTMTSGTVRRLPGPVQAMISPARCRQLPSYSGCG